MFKVGDIVRFNEDGIKRWNDYTLLKDKLYLNFIVVDNAYNVMVYIKVDDGDINGLEHFIANKHLTNITRIEKIKKLMINDKR